MTVRAAVAAASGYAGGELLRLLPTQPRGLPELPGGRVEPAVLPVLAPAYARGPAEPAAVVVAASGTSGAATPRGDLPGSEVTGSVHPYGVGGGHRRTPEKGVAP